MTTFEMEKRRRSQGDGRDEVGPVSSTIVGVPITRKGPSYDDDMALLLP